MKWYIFCKAIPVHPQVPSHNSPRAARQSSPASLLAITTTRYPTKSGSMPIAALAAIRPDKGRTHTKRRDKTKVKRRDASIVGHVRIALVRISPGRKYA